MVTDLQTGDSTELVYNVDGITDRQAPNSFISYSHPNWYSLEPSNYSFLLTTSDGLYELLYFEYQLVNEEPAVQEITVAKFTGLPQSDATLKIAYTDLYGDLIED